MHRKRPFRTSDDGAAIIEFAIVAPALFLLLIGFIELGLILFTTAVLEGATDVGSRIGKTDYTTSDLSRETYILNQINAFSGGFLNLGQVNISIRSYKDFTSVNRGAGSAYAGGAGAVVVYRVTYPWRLFTPVMGSLLGTNGIYNITAVATVRNEPF